MIVDDEEAFAQEIAEAVDYLGGSAVFFTCPVQCLEYLGHNETDFDVILADLAMPKLNGLEFLEMAKQHIPATATKILITGLAEIDGQAISVDKEIEVLNKPISLRDLKKKWGTHDSDWGG